LKYHLPAFRSSICASVRVAVPSIGLFSFAIVITGGAFDPGAAGPWKWEVALSRRRRIETTPSVPALQFRAPTGRQRVRNACPFRGRLVFEIGAAGRPSPASPSPIDFAAGKPAHKLASHACPYRPSCPSGVLSKQSKIALASPSPAPYGAQRYWRASRRSGFLEPPTATFLRTLSLMKSTFDSA
jgi:hypothetical protein